MLYTPIQPHAACVSDVVKVCCVVQWCKRLESAQIQGQQNKSHGKSS